MTDLPRIPLEEYPLRWQAVRDVLVRENLDMLLLYADDRHTYGAAYARYYANFAPAFEPLLLLFLPEGDPILLTGPETQGYAKETGVVADVRVLKEFAAENEDYPYTELTPLADVVKEKVGTAARVGIGGKGLMGADLYETLRRELAEAEFIPMDAILEPMRGVKSEAELKVIRYAYYLANLGMQAAIDAIGPGVTEREIAAAAEFVMRKNGSEGTGIDTIVCSGSNTNHILGRTTLRKVQENDLVVITIAPRYEGYHGACSRSVIVGNPGEDVIASVEAEIRAAKVCAANLLPGNVGSEVEAMGRAVMAEAGYGENFLYSGLHSVGVIEFEPPILGPSSTTVLENNMVISIDIPLFEAPVMGSRTEDGYLLHDGIAERLTPIDMFIRK